jgi:hypothetical protein
MPDAFEALDEHKNADDQTLSKKVGGFRMNQLKSFLGARSSPTEIRGEEGGGGKNLTAKRIVSEGGKEIADWMNNQMENRKSEQAQQVSVSRSCSKR